MDEETLDNVIHKLFSEDPIEIKDERRERRWHHYIGELERKARECTRHYQPQDYCHGMHYISITTSIDDKTKVEYKYHKGKLVKVKVYH